MPENSRRELKIRNRQWVNSVAASISKKNITPNQISILSVVFAVLAAVCFVSFGVIQKSWLLLLALVCIQLRLLCNLFDGLVAIEGGKSTTSGELFNDVPDRIADPAILVSVGYALSDYAYAVELGWVAALLSVMTAYVRTLASSIGAPTSFAGPMAKQHRMAVITLGCLSGFVENYANNSTVSLYAALAVVVIGCVITVYRRLKAAYRYLENAHD